MARLVGVSEEEQLDEASEESFAGLPPHDENDDDHQVGSRGEFCGSRNSSPSLPPLILCDSDSIILKETQPKSQHLTMKFTVGYYSILTSAGFK